MSNPARIGVLKNIGFFRFVADFPRQIEALAKAIKEERERHPEIDIRNSLIVLPEAFNIGRSYDTPACPLPAGGILERLRRELAEPLNIAFVVGILDGRTSSAHWVDAAESVPLCHKMGDDLKKLYDPCTKNQDPCNPIGRGEARIAALICMDATDGESCIQDRRERLSKRLREGEGTKIICVPARFTVNKPDPFGLLPDIPDYWYVVADGEYHGTSFVVHADAGKPDGPSDPKLLEATSPSGNVVRLRSLS